MNIFKTTVLPVVVYGFRTSLLTFMAIMEEHRLRMFENKVLRIFGPKRD
jgi:hypothetical protein